MSRHAPTGLTGRGSRYSFGAPAFGGAFLSATANQSLFDTLHGSSFNPVRVGSRFNAGGPRGVGSGTYSYENTLGQGNNIWGSIPGLVSLNGPGQGGPTPEQQSALDDFYSTPLTELELSNTPEGQRALGQKQYTEWLLARAGWGPQAGNAGPLTANLYDDASRDAWSADFGQRGPASALALDRAGSGTYRTQSRVGHVETAGGHNGGGNLLYQGNLPGEIPLNDPVGSEDHEQSFGGPAWDTVDPLLAYQNIVSRVRQDEFGATPYPDNATGDRDFLPPNPAGGSTDPPVDYNAAALERRSRSKRRSIGAAARGRAGQSRLAAGTRGLLNEDPAQGATKLGG